jgi:hypothetical protein
MAKIPFDPKAWDEVMDPDEEDDNNSDISKRRVEGGLPRRSLTRRRLTHNRIPKEERDARIEDTEVTIRNTHVFSQEPDETTFKRAKQEDTDENPPRSPRSFGEDYLQTVYKGPFTDWHKGVDNENMRRQLKNSTPAAIQKANRAFNAVVNMPMKKIGEMLDGWEEQTKEGWVCKTESDIPEPEDLPPMEPSSSSDAEARAQRKAREPKSRR